MLQDTPFYKQKTETHKKTHTNKEEANRKFKEIAIWIKYFKMINTSKQRKSHGHIHISPSLPVGVILLPRNPAPRHNFQLLGGWLPAAAKQDLYVLNTD